MNKVKRLQFERSLSCTGQKKLLNLMTAIPFAGVKNKSVKIIRENIMAECKG